MASGQQSTQGESILIVGAGVFGLSTALELSRRGHKNIIVVDRYLPPVPDGSSVDISRIIRTDYADPLYSKMANEARDGWLSTYKNFYYRCGFVQLSETKEHAYINKCKDLLRQKKQAFTELEDAGELVKTYPALNGPLKGMTGYFNTTGGWADAEKAIQFLAQQCSEAGVSFVVGARGTVESLLTSNNKIRGVNVKQGPPLLASRVILCTGAWTNQLINLTKQTISTGQPVGFIQLSVEEAERLKDLPVCINMSSGFFCFPPTPGTNILKVARHGFGYETRLPVDPRIHSASLVSSPKRDSNGAANTYIPEDAEDALRQGLRLLLPDFAERPWINRRLCWYTDTPEGNFVVDNHPNIDGVFLATGGSGHAYKFLPILGKYIADCFENKAPADIRRKWAVGAVWDRNHKGDGSRGGPPRRTLWSQEQARL